MEKLKFYPRYILPRILEALQDSPVVLIQGPRQSGKTTLVKKIGEQEGYTYFSFDNDIQRNAAKTDPIGYVADLPDRVILDEVQKVPEIFTSLKASIDQRREAGRFILTGSAHVLLVPKLSDSLAGRMEIIRLHPFSQAELGGDSTNFLENLFRGRFLKNPLDQRLGKTLADLLVSGGFPVPLQRSTHRRRIAWYKNYIDTLVQRDVRELSKISLLDTLPRLLTIAAGQTARLLNVSNLASPFQVSRPTVREYLTLLSKIFLLEELPPWHNNRLKRLVKTPKLHITDTGIICALLGLDATMLRQDRAIYGQILETFIYQELRRIASWQEELYTFSYYRDKDKVEVDIVLESEGKLAGIEVKASSTVGSKDFTGLRRLSHITGPRFTSGVVLYDGEMLVPFGESLYAVPISRFFQK